MTTRPPQQRRSFWTRPRLAFTLVALALLLAVGSSSCRQEVGTENSPAEKNRAGSSPSTGGNAAPANLASLAPLPAPLKETSIQMLDGGSLRLADLAGKVVILDLWATWCPPCREEIPHLIELGNEYRDEGLEVIGVTTEDPETDEAKVRSFAEEFQINYKLGWAGREIAVGILSMSGRDSIPQTLIITRDGRILKHIVGFDPKRTPASMRAAVEQALKL